MSPLLTPQPQASAVRQMSDRYDDYFASSRKAFAQARQFIAGGTTHDGWLVEPFPVYIKEAAGACKYTLENYRLVDYWMGHGALIQGHSFPPVIEAVNTQVKKGTHYGAPSELEIEWAKLVCSLIPSAERVRFTSSGTEATMLALRVARAYTGRPLIIKFDGHFHGWHDESLAHFFSPGTAGLNEAATSQVFLANPFSPESVEEMMDDEVAAIILEPGGGSSGGLSWSAEQLQTLREITRKNGTLLIFDEVVSGFRYSPGGVQALCGILPDITVLGKILSGGLPGGAVAGREEIMEVFGVGKTINQKRIRIPHTGTFNGNPLSAAAGIALLQSVADGIAQEKAVNATESLVNGVNQLAEKYKVDVALYGQSSTFHILIGARQAGYAVEPSAAIVKLYAENQKLYADLRRRLLTEGVDSHPIHGWLSSAHDEYAINKTLEAFEETFKYLKDVPEFLY